MGLRAALRSGDWKIVRNSRTQSGVWELYNLADDLSEANDLANSHAVKLDELRAMWQSVNATMAEPIRW